MNEKIKLSKRLRKTASYLPEGAVFADIGSDHAYLPCHVCLMDKSAKAIAGEINEGPFNSAVETVTQFGLTNAIEVRLGNGLQVLNEGEVQQIIIAGMGGSLIKTILDAGIQKLTQVDRIIAQPNIDARNVRKWFNQQNFTITGEAIIEENGHIYEIIAADKQASDNPYKNGQMDKQLLFGPFLLKDKSAVFYKKWNHEYIKLQRVINQMKCARVKDIEKIFQFEKELSWIEEVINDEGNPD